MHRVVNSYELCNICISEIFEIVPRKDCFTIIAVNLFVAQAKKWITNAILKCIIIDQIIVILFRFTANRILQAL